MTREQAPLVRSAVQEYELYDSRKVLAAVDKHWPALLAEGVTEDMRARFRRALDVAERWEGRRHPARIALDAARLRLKDQLGAYRLSADLVAEPLVPNPRAARALKMRQRFPLTDAALRRYCKGLDAGMRRYSRSLARRGFSREQQVELSRLGREFTAALDALPGSREEGAESAQREEQLATLRQYCRHFRAIAYEALPGDPRQTDFDRVRLRPNPLRLVGSG